MAWKNTINFMRRPLSEKPIVFYSANGSYKNYLEPVILYLVNELKCTIHYVTSDPNDPWLKTAGANFETHFVGQGSALITFYQFLNCGILITTTPDLEILNLRRSFNPVHYLYIHHSMVSSHMIYRTSAFDHFDSILCVGPHHIKEIRQWEKLKKLPKKGLYQHGYGPLDSIIEESKNTKGPSLSKQGAHRILLAPSWGKEGILERGADRLVRAILDAGYHLTVRPHPQSRKLSSGTLDSLKQTFSNHINFIWEEDIRSHVSFHAAHVMISDWSGAALEFSFGLGRPVLFIDVPRKVNNPEYLKIAFLPLEVSVREDIGMVIARDDTNGLIQALSEISSDYLHYRGRAVAARDRWVYNVGKSGAAGAKVISELSDMTMRGRND